MARHGHRITICDAGFPIPKGCDMVDLSLVAGIPSFFDTLKAVLNEIIVESYITVDHMKQYNPRGLKLLGEMMPVQERTELSFEEFIKQSEESILFIRTGELTPDSNIILVSASGVKEVCGPLEVSFDEVSFHEVSFDEVNFEREGG